MKLPPDYQSNAALVRITRGLEAGGADPQRAEWAAVTALDEAPFGVPTEEGWATACNRAKKLAVSDDVLDKDGYGLYPARFDPQRR
jgi:hypothetical protein